MQSGYVESGEIVGLIVRQSDASRVQDLQKQIPDGAVCFFDLKVVRAYLYGAVDAEEFISR